VNITMQIRGKKSSILPLLAFLVSSSNPRPANRRKHVNSR